MKKSIYFKETAFNSRMAEIEKAKDHFQNILNETLKLDVVKIASTQDLLKLLAHGEAFIKEKIAEGIEVMSFGPFKLSRKKAVEILDLPSFETVNRLCEDARTFSSFTKYMTLKGDKVEIDKEAIEAIRDQFSIFANTDEEVKLYEAHKAAAQALHQLNEAHRKVFGYEIFLQGNELRQNLFYYDPGKVDSTHLLIEGEKKLVSENRWGDKIWETIVPDKTLLQTKRLTDPKVTLNEAYYESHRFPSKD